MNPAATVRAAGTAAGQAVRTAADRLTPASSGPPLRIEHLTARWLATALDLPATAITDLRVLEANSGTAARARIAVDAGHTGLPDRLFVKLPPRDYLQHVLLNVFGLGAREILAYRALGTNPPIRVPRCYVAHSDPRRQRTVLVLEDLAATARFRTVTDTVTRPEAEAVVDALADLHIAFWNSDRFTGDLRPLTVRTAADARLAALIRRRFLHDITGHTADLIPAPIKRQARIFYQRGTDIDAFWAAQPRTLTHADPHLGNLYFTGDGPGFLDWQIATAGPGIRDIAYFATASVEPHLLRRIERDLVDRYAARLDAADIPADPALLWTHYRAAATELFLAIVCTAEAGERMQPFDISRIGVQRAVAAVTAHDSFTVLTTLVDGGHVR